MDAISRINGSTVAKRCVKIADVASFYRELEKVHPGANFLGLADIESNTGEISSRSTEQTAEGQCFRFKKGDILFARLRPYLNKVWYAEYEGVCSTEFHVIRIRDTKSGLMPQYVAAVLRSSFTVAQTRHMMTGNTHPRLASDDVVNLLIPIPPADIQQQIVEEIESRRNVARSLRESAQVEWESGKIKFESDLLGENLEQ